MRREGRGGEGREEGGREGEGQKRREEEERGGGGSELFPYLVLWVPAPLSRFSSCDFFYCKIQV